MNARDRTSDFVCFLFIEPNTGWLFTYKVVTKYPDQWRAAAIKLFCNFAVIEGQQ